MSGRAHLLLADHNVVFAQENAIILYGVSDLVVVTCDGLTLVTTVERSADLKTLVEGLPSWACECRRRSIQSDRGAASMAREFLEAATPRLDTSDSETSGASGGA